MIFIAPLKANLRRVRYWYA